MSAKTNIPVLDGLRAFAALTVCLYHCVCTTTGYITSPSVLTVFTFGRYGVQTFFIISGFIIPWTMNNADYHFRNFFSFLLKRLARLEPPYLVSLGLALGVMALRYALIGNTGDIQEMSATRVALHFGYLIPFFKDYAFINQVYWTLGVEFQYYLFIALMFVPLTNYGMGVRILSYLLFMGMGLFNNVNFLGHWSPVFLLGIQLFLFKSKKIGHLEYYLATGLAVTWCIYLYEPGEVLFAGIAVAMILYFQDLESLLGDFFGKISYSLYLIHPFVGATVINVLSHRVSHPGGKALVIFIGMAVTVVGAWLMYRFVEKPSKRLSSSITY